MKRFFSCLAGLSILAGIFFASAFPSFADEGGVVIQKPEYNITVDKSPDQEGVFRISKVYEDSSSENAKDSEYKGRIVGFDYELKALSVESLSAQGIPETAAKGYAEILAGSDYVDIDAKKLIDTKKFKSDLGLSVFLIIDEKSLKGADGVKNNGDIAIPLMSDKITEYMEQAQKAAESLKANGSTDVDSIFGMAADGSGQVNPAEILGSMTAPSAKGILNFFNIDLKFIVISVLAFLAIVILGCFAIAKSHSKQKRRE
jgi:hypothetical protein